MLLPLLLYMTSIKLQLILLLLICVPFKGKRNNFCLDEEAAEVLISKPPNFFTEQTSRFLKQTTASKNCFWVRHFVWMPWHSTENYIPPKNVTMQMCYPCDEDCSPLRKQFSSFDNILSYVLLLFVSECWFILLFLWPPVEVGFLPIESYSMEHIRLHRVS